MDSLGQGSRSNSQTPTKSTLTSIDSKLHHGLQNTRMRLGVIGKRILRIAAFCRAAISACSPDVQIILLPIINLLVCSSIALATVQAPDLVTIGGRTYGIEQQPMLGLWHHGDGQSDGREPMPRFEVTSTANWRGYVATFSISNDKLHLLDIDAQIGGKRKTGRQILGKRLPAVARWFTGSLFISLGDFDFEAQTSRYVLEFVIVRGVVTDTRYHDSHKIPVTWNGRPRIAQRLRIDE